MMLCNPLKKCEFNKCGLCDKPCKRPPCKPLCPCIKKIEDVKNDLHTLEGKVDRNTYKIENNYNLLNDAISDLAEKHARDHNYVINYIDLKDAENDYLLQLEISRAKTAEQDLDDRLAKEIADRIEDVNEEESRAKAAETTITNNLNLETQNRINGDVIIQLNITNLLQRHDYDIQDMNNHLDDILGIDAQGVSEIKAILSDDDTTTGLITELATKATKVALQNEIDRSTGKDNSHDIAILNLQNDKANKSSITAGTYRSVTVNSEGIVTAGTNPTTLSDYGITNAYTKDDVDAIINGLVARLTVLESYWRLNTTTNRLETSYVIEPEGYR